MKVLIIMTLYTLFNSCALAFTNDLFLKGGFSAGLASLETLDDPLPGTQGRPLDSSHSTFATFGLNSSFGVMLTDWEFSAISNITFGKVKDLSIYASGDVIKGSGSYRNVAIGPLVKYFSPLKIKKNWKLYFGVGPSWSIQTIKMDRFTSSSGNFTGNQKLAIESFGQTIVIGIQEQLLFKEMHPVFYEISFSHRESFKISTVDASKFTETNVLSSDEKGQEVEDTIVVFSMGIVLF